MSGLGLLLAMVALSAVAAVVALAAPFRPPPRRLPHGGHHAGPHAGHQAGPHGGYPAGHAGGHDATHHSGHHSGHHPGHHADPAVVPAGRGPPAPPPRPARPAVTWAVALLAGLAFGPPGAVATLLVASAVPRWRRQREARLRLAALESELPEVVDLLALAVGAGMTVAHAVTAVARRGLGPLSAELRIVAGEVAHGRRLADALDELPRRAGEPARPLAATLAACERYGTPVADALERLAAEARDRQRRRAEQAARRLPVLLLFPLVLCILPAFALVAVVPLIADAVPALRL